MKIFLPLLLILGVFMITLSSCSTSEKSSEGMKVEEAPPPLAPGSALVEAELLNSTDSENGTIYKLKIVKVLEYGASTASISENVEMDVMMSKSLEKDNKIENGKNYKLILRGGSPLGEESKNQNWQISKIF